ncbi:hypothetical protein [Aureispira anguillae]|uniref:Uncharacterized protein n=1 Tax=Aureispira anguillae TaxID=2864201 RepID=A0A916DXQ8_9BACT|nr:hypothetical protein [Aureispira anguillae]BDS15311.1 hypothetical protein AsAng_0060950 [Aureispira anguillae]
MKKMIIFLLLTIIACSKQEQTLVGVWQVSNSFYRANYQIVAKRNGFTGKILYYNDGTSQYTKNDQLTLFKGLTFQDSVYVDGISGATSSSNTSRTICIKIKSQDTLEATTYVMAHPVTELWIRQK